MPFISVTRLRIRAFRFLPAFAFHALRTRAQVRRAPGFEAGAILADRDRTFWTLTAWADEADMRRYILAGAHRQAMPCLIRWCDEASVVHWTQEEGGLPGWVEADRRMRADGRPSKIRYPSTQLASMMYRAPKLGGSGPIHPARARNAEPARH